MKKWIAVYTKPRHEKTVANKLKEKNIENYLPLLKERRKWKDRKKWVEFPLFRSYIFARTELKNALFVLKTPGVIKIIRLGKHITIIRDDEIKAIKSIIKGGFKPKATDYFLKGDKVDVKAGPLKGISGEVIRLDSQDRLIVRVDAIQHSISVQIDGSYLKPIA